MSPTLGDDQSEVVAGVLALIFGLLEPGTYLEAPPIVLDLHGHSEGMGRTEIGDVALILGPGANLAVDELRDVPFESIGY